VPLLAAPRVVSSVIPLSFRFRGWRGLTTCVVLMVAVGISTVAWTLSSSAVIPAGNLTPNPSFEGTSLAGWSSWQGTLSRVALSNAPDGSHVARITSAGSDYSLELDPAVVSTTAGVKYFASAEVEAASADAVGQPVQLTVRERNSGGSWVAQTSANATLGTSFRRLSVTATVKHSGDRLDLYVYVAGGSAFYADVVTLTTDTSTPTPTPTPTPAPGPISISNVPCTVTISGAQNTGACSGTFNPASGPTPSPTATSTPTATPTPKATSTPTPTPTPHTGAAPVVVILMENEEASSIVGNSSMPYLNGTLIPHSLLLTNYTAVSHPSLPNYDALTSGMTESCGDSCPANFTQNNIFNELHQAGISFASFDESMTSPCEYGNSGEYASKHNPEVYYTDIAGSVCNATDLPFSSLNFSHLPQFSFVTPNLISDMHDGSAAQGDAWLSANVPKFQASGATVIVVFDEGSTDIGGGGQVFADISGAGASTGKNSSAFNHYGLLHGILNHFGLGCVGASCSASAVSIP
jgi:phosphatidylinositol-3-phosphatase